MKLKIESLPIESLTFDPANARKHSEANLSAIEQSLRLFGQRKPIVITSDNLIVAGNGTVEAALFLGWTDIAVVRVPADWDATQVQAFALADNRTSELAEWNHDVLAVQLFELLELDFDVKAIGFEAPVEPNSDEWEAAFDATSGERSDVQQITFTLHTDQVEMVKNALATSKALGEFGDTGNPNTNGNALARICEMWQGQNE